MDSDFILYQAVTDPVRIKTLLANHTDMGGRVLIRSAGRSASLPLLAGQSAAAEMVVDGKGAAAELLTPGKKISVWFDTKDSGYFFECSPRRQNDFVFLTPHECLFQQQRRAEFRYLVPPGYSVIFIGKGESQQWPINDLNRSGFNAVVAGDTSLKEGDRRDGHLVVGSHGPVEVAAKVRRLQRVGGKVNAGFEFDHNVYKSDVDLAERLLYLRHDVYHLKK